MKRSRLNNKTRRGAATVELAICAPILVMLVFASVEWTRAIERTNILAMAAREGARTASIDREGLANSGETTNQMVTDDVLDFLAAQGFSRDEVTVVIADDEDINTPFDLDDPDNEHELFQIQVSTDFVSLTSYVRSMTLTGRTVFLNGRVH